MKAFVIFLMFIGFTYAGFSQQDINPEAKTHVYTGIKLEQKEDWEGALEEYTKAIQIEPEYAEAYYYRGMLIILHGEEEIKEYGCADLELAKHFGYGPASSPHYNYCFQ